MEGFYSSPLFIYQLKPFFYINGNKEVKCVNQIGKKTKVTILGYGEEKLDKVEFDSYKTVVDDRIKDTVKTINGVVPDENGNVVVDALDVDTSTFVKEINGVKPVDGKVSIPVPEVDTSTLATKTEVTAKADKTYVDATITNIQSIESSLLVAKTEINNAKGSFSTLQEKLNSMVIEAGGTPSNVILFEDWIPGESVTIDTGNTPPTDTTPPIVTISPVAGTYTAIQNITLTANEAATIYYTIDGTTPTTSSTIYTSPIALNSTKTLKYFAKDTAGNVSSIQSALFTINIDTTAPILSITSGGTFTGTKTVTMTVNETADIFYTLNGITPTTSSSKYTTPLSISTTTTLKAFAKDTAGNVSTVQTVNYTLDTTVPSDTTPPENVTELTVSNKTQTSLTLSWIASTSSDTASYDILNGSTVIGNVTGTTYNVTGLVANTTYTFTVKAKDASNNITSGVSITDKTLEVVTAPSFVNDSSLLLNRTNLTGQNNISSPNTYFNGNEKFTLYMNVLVPGDYINLLTREMEVNTNARVRLRVDGGTPAMQIATTFTGKNATTDAVAYAAINKSTDTVIDPSKYVQLAWVRTNTHIKFYIDNVLKGQVACDSNLVFDSSGNKPLISGGNNGSNQSPTFKNILYYNRELTEAELTQNYNALK